MLPLYMFAQGADPSYTYEMIIQVESDTLPPLGKGATVHSSDAGAVFRLQKILGNSPGDLISTAAQSLGRNEDPRMIANRMQISGTPGTVTLRFSDADAEFAQEFLRRLYEQMQARAYDQHRKQWEADRNGANTQRDSLLEQIRKAEQTGDRHALDSLERVMTRQQERRIAMEIQRAAYLPGMRLLQGPQVVH